MWWLGVAVAVVLTVFFIAAMIVGKRAYECEYYRPRLGSRRRAQTSILTGKNDAQNL